MHRDFSSQSPIKPNTFNEAEKTNEYWHQHAKDFIAERLNLAPNTKKARNVIMFLGDGLSHATIGKSKKLKY